MKAQRKKKTKIMWITIGMIAALCGCGSKQTSEEASAVDAVQTQQAQEITVTFMKGEETLGTVQTLAGEIIESDAYEAYEKDDGAAFLGWYETPGFLESSKKDLTQDTFDENTTLFGSFEAKEVAADTRKWYVAGTSQTGILKDNNWAGSDVAEADREKFRLNSTGNQVNEFAITLDLYAGDQFQGIPDWNWSGQKGYGCFTQLDETQMESGGSLGDSANTANVNVLVDGNYTITLTTNPDNPALDTVTVVRNSDPLAQ